MSIKRFFEEPLDLAFGHEIEKYKIGYMANSCTLVTDVDRYEYKEWMLHNQDYKKLFI